VSSAIFMTRWTEWKNTRINNKDLSMEPHENVRFEVFIVVIMKITVFFGDMV
jgi:hypothetical protein